MNNIRLAAELKLDSEQRAKQRRPPSWILDKIADEKLSGKYNIRKSNLCGSCFTYRSENGSCNC